MRLSFLVEGLHAGGVQLPAESRFSHTDLKDTARTAFFGWFAKLTDKDTRAVYAFDPLFVLFPDWRAQIQAAAQPAVAAWFVQAGLQLQQFELSPIRAPVREGSSRGRGGTRRWLPCRARARPAAGPRWCARSKPGAGPASSSWLSADDADVSEARSSSASSFCRRKIDLNAPAAALLFSSWI